MFCTKTDKIFKEKSLTGSSISNSQNSEENNVYDKGMSTYNSSEVISINPELNIQDMIDNERNQILERNQMLYLQQKRFKPISSGNFLLMRLAMILFPLNLILLIIWSFRKKTNSNRKAFARSTLLYYAIIILTVLIVIVCLVLSGVSIIPDDLFNKIMS